MGVGDGPGHQGGPEAGRPEPGPGDRRLRPAARVRPARRRGPGHPAGQALVRHDDGPRVRTPDPEARRGPVGPPSDGRPLPSGLHGAQDPLAQAARTRAFPEAQERPPAARLPQFSPDRKDFHGMRRRLGDGAPGRQEEDLVGGGDLGGRPEAGRLPSRALPGRRDRRTDPARAGPAVRAIPGDARQRRAAETT